MTKNELSKLYFLRKEISEQERQIERLETMATSCSTRLSDMPHGTGKSDKIGKIGAKIADLKSKLEKRIIVEREITDFIENIDDPIIRLILIYRCEHCYSWAKIAWKIGGNNTSNTVRKMYSRFIKKHF